jgi:hypothetical protein
MATPSTGRFGGYGHDRLDRDRCSPRAGRRARVRIAEHGLVRVGARGQSERRPGREVEVDARRRAGEPTQRARNARGERVGHVADAQPRRRRVAGVARGLLCDFGVPQHVPRLLEQAGARDGELNAALTAVEELDPELLLESAHLLAYCRLRDLKALRCPAEVQFLGDGD